MPSNILDFLTIQCSLQKGEQYVTQSRPQPWSWSHHLVDEQGNETLFEILLTIDGREEFGKNYVLLVPAGAEEDANGEIEIQAYSFTENEDGTEGDLQPILKIQMLNGIWSKKFSIASSMKTKK